MTAAARASWILVFLAGCAFEKDNFHLGQSPDADDAIDAPESSDEDAADGPDGGPLDEVDGPGIEPDAPFEAECSLAAVLTCGSNRAIASTLVAPAASDIELYSDCVSWSETGPELFYGFVAPAAGTYSVTLTDVPPRDANPPAADLDVFVLEGNCEANDCEAYGDNVATFTAVAGKDYYFAVDGFMGAAGAFAITLTCPP